MSSIIDALKKSDSNRSKESGANLNQIKFGQQPPQKSRRGFLLLVALLLLVAFGVFAWSQGWHHSAIAQAKSWFTSEQPDTEQSVTQTESQPNTQVNQQPVSQVVAKSTTEQANKLTPPKANEVKAKRLAVEQAQTDSDSERKQSLEVIAARNTDTDSEDDPATKAGAIDRQKTDQSTANLNSQTSAVDEAAEKADQIAKQNRKDLEPALKQDYLLVHQIDFEIRKNIPPIKLNIHIFDPDPENRMVILNGIKYATGDIIEELVTVGEINQEGVVLEFEGIKFLIPK